MKFIAAIFATVAFAAAIVPRAGAHSLGAECRLRNNQVELEAFYGDDTPARHANVEVRNTAGDMIAEGKTDNDGRWSFPLPAAGDYQVVVDAGMGHRTTVALTISQEQLATGQGGIAGSIRNQFTRTPWLRIAMGLAIVALLGLVFQMWLRRSREPQAERLPPHN
ncbi:MAG TPA: carboxypeptidase-like regulatory domain-containing protein [Gemmataceae bacterium]|jgi:nickel transport protein|nr:carboxypeptidase-like regulatory domain-containing protein [Gemmataceae bacterium]